MGVSFADQQVRVQRRPRHGGGAPEAGRQLRCGHVLPVPALLPGGRRGAGAHPTGELGMR